MGQPQRVGVHPEKLTSIRVGEWTPTILNEIPQDRRRDTRTDVGYRRDRVFLVSVQDKIAEIPAKPVCEEIHRVREGSWDDDVPDDVSVEGLPLSETIERLSIPFTNAKYFLWHSEGEYMYPAGLPMWSTLDVATLTPQVRFLLARKADVMSDERLRALGKNGRKIAAIENRADLREQAVDHYAWKPLVVLATGPGGTEVATFTEFAAQDRHKHERSTEIYTVLKGQMQIWIDDQGPYPMVEGDEVIVLPGTVHQVVQQTPRHSLPPDDVDLVVRVHAVECFGDEDKYVQLAQDGEWVMWKGLSSDARKSAIKK